MTCTYNMASNIRSATWPWMTRMRKRNTFTGIRYLGVEQINYRQEWRQKYVSNMVSLARQRWHHFLLTSLPNVDVRSRPKARGGCCCWPREVWGSHLCSPTLFTFVYTPRTCLMGGTWGYSRYIFEYFMGLRQTETSGCQVFFKDFILSVWLLY